MGYLGMENKTKEVIDDERWFNTRDIGYKDEVSIWIRLTIVTFIYIQDGNLHIICRVDGNLVESVLCITFVVILL